MSFSVGPAGLAEAHGRGTGRRTRGSADLSGVSGAATFFVNGRHHHGAHDIATLYRSNIELSSLSWDYAAW
jgi:hypothetical protein